MGNNHYRRRPSLLESDQDRCPPAGDADDPDRLSCRKRHSRAARPPVRDITGFANLEPSLGGKWLELLSEIAPGLKRASIMFNPDTAPVSAFRPSLETAALQQIIASVQSDVEIEAAIIALGREPGASLVVMPDTFAVVHRAPIISAAWFLKGYCRPTFARSARRGRHWRQQCRSGLG